MNLHLDHLVSILKLESINKLWLVLFLGVALRLVLVILVDEYPERYITADAIGYHQLAQNIVAGNGFSRHANAPYLPDNFRTPIYPFTLSLVYILLGHYPSAILYLQVIIGALTIMVVYYIGRFIKNHTVGLSSALLFSISPHSIIYTALLWSDTMFTFLLTLSILAAIIMISSKEFKWIFLSGFSIGVATLTHPRSLYIPILIGVVFLIYSLKNRISIKHSLGQTLLYLFAFLITLSPWLIRNYLVFGTPNLSSASGMNMLYYGAALTEASQTGENQWSISERYESQISAMSNEPLDEAEFSKKALQFSLKKISQHPLSYLKVHLIGTAKVFLPGTFTINSLLAGKSEVHTGSIYSAFIVNPFGKNKLVNALGAFPFYVWAYVASDIIYLSFIYMLSLRSFMKSRQSLSWTTFLIAIIAYLATVAGSAGAPRFRVALMPFLCLTSAIALASLQLDFKPARNLLLCRKLM